MISCVVAEKWIIPWYDDPGKPMKEPFQGKNLGRIWPSYPQGKSNLL